MTEPVLGDLPQFQVALRRQLTFYLRTYRFVGLFLFTTIIAGASLAFSVYEGRADAGVSGTAYLQGFLGSLGGDAILVAAFLGGDAIAMDFGSARGYYMLVQPVRRRVLLAGRFAAAFLACLVIGIAYLVLAVAGAVYWFGAGGVPWGAVVASIALLALTVAAALAVAFCVSSAVKSPEVSIIASVLLLYLGLSVGTAGAEIASVEPWFSLSYAAAGISNVFATDLVHAAPFGFGVPGTAYSAYPWESAVILVGYVVVFVGAAALLYARKESRG
jgi:ABC-type transport system involved in multi-copper enzyme maturation permease subunit